jgi:hypothetical protein
MTTGTIELGYTKDSIHGLIKARLHCHDFHRILASPAAHFPEGWDSNNHWALKELKNYDTSEEQELVYIPGRIEVIRKEPGTWSQVL